MSKEISLYEILPSKTPLPLLGICVDPHWDAVLVTAMVDKALH